MTLADEKKGITVKIDADLHAEVKEYIEQHGMTMAEFITLAVDNELHPKYQNKEETNMISNGVCITARFSEFPSNGAACILSDILETNVPESYFLSTAAMRKISSNLSPDRKVSVSTIQAEVPALNAPAPVDGAVKQDCTS